MKENLLVSSSPHLRGGRKTNLIMLDVIIALMPAVIASGIIFGVRALIILAITTGTCVLSEWVCRKVMKRDNTIGDLSAVVTGILLAFNLPVSIHPVMAGIGGVVAIVVVKQMFGGLGQNFVNPALTARIVLMASFPSQMSTWYQPFYYTMDASTPDALTTATPLGILGKGTRAPLPSYLDMFLGNTAGCLGETCALALILGGLYLIVRRVISPIIPLCYIATVVIFSLIFGRDILVDLLSGGLLLGAFFMATDYATTPINWKGKIIFAVGCGIITMVIRIFGALPEGVSFSIILMNIVAPHIEKLTRPRAFGKARKERKKNEA